MKCRQALKLLYEYLDNELDSKDVEDVKQHLAECKHCFETYKFEENVDELIRKKSRSPQDVTDVVSRIKSEVETRISELSEDNHKHRVAKEDKPPRFFLFRRPVFAVGFFALIAIIGFSFFVKYSQPSAWASEFTEGHDAAVSGQRQMDIMDTDLQVLQSFLSAKMQLPDRIFFHDENCHPNGGMIGNHGEKPVAQLVYDVHGNPVSMFVMKLGDFNRPANMQLVPGTESTYSCTYNGHSVLIWNCPKYWYIATTSLDNDGILDFVSNFNQ